MGRLILLRHGESEWNRKNIFTGWIDIPLSEAGVEEALEAGKQFQDVPIDMIFTSTLIRGMMSAMLAMCVRRDGKVPVVLHPGEGKLEDWSKCYDEETEKNLIPVIRAWELNERMYGELQGRNKQKTRERFGDEQVKLWRRSYHLPPPNGESLKMTAERTLPFFEKKIMPELKKGKNIFIAAHGNSLRSIVMKLDRLSEEEVINLEIPTGHPLFYDYHDETFKKVPD